MIVATVNGKEERLFNVNEVALYLGVVSTTLNRWYLFKKENPDSEWSNMIPDYVTLSDNQRAQRYWREGEIFRLMEFRDKFPKGRNGIMGSVTQRYVKQKKKEKKNGKKKTGRSSKSKQQHIASVDGAN